MSIEKLAFGSTGHESTRTLFGAAALSRVDQATADETLEVLLEHGVNHIDVAASYGDAELRVGAWMPKYRDRFFLATKTNQTRYEAARDQIEESAAPPAGRHPGPDPVPQPHGRNRLADGAQPERRLEGGTGGEGAGQGALHRRDRPRRHRAAHARTQPACPPLRLHPGALQLRDVEEPRPIWPT